MRKFCNWITKYWWIILIFIVTGYIVFVSIIDIPELNRVTYTAFKYLNKIIAPLGVVIGLMLGYPLLKRRLLDSYVTKQFEIIYQNNRKVRKECLRLKDKYPVKDKSQALSSDYLLSIVNDVKRLYELAFDANPDAYKYSYLLYKSLQTFQKKVNKTIPKHFYELYYNETLSSFVNNHIERIYQYSWSIGFAPKNSNIKEDSILNNKIKKYVIENKYYHVDCIDHSFSYKIASALLVSFFSTNISCLRAQNISLFQSCYETAPSPSPFARIMYNNNIYMPLVLKGDFGLGLIGRLELVGFKRETTTNGTSSVIYLICHYANISCVGFVQGCIKDKESFVKYEDAYIGKNVLSADDIKEFYIDGERAIIKIEERKAMSYFSQIRNLLCKKMNKEVRY